MGKIDQNIVAEAKKQVEILFDAMLPDTCVYHSKKHTLNVLRNVEIIGTYCLLDEDEMNMVKLCAIFHDVGYIYSYDGHESESARIAYDFLASRNIDTKNMELVYQSILATKVPQNPQHKIARILCDADLMYLANEDYFAESSLMHLEWAKVGKAELTEPEFHKVSLDFFMSHQYHTQYGQQILEPLKHKTELRIRNRLLHDN